MMGIKKEYLHFLKTKFFIILLRVPTAQSHSSGSFLFIFNDIFNQ